MYARNRGHLLGVRLHAFVRYDIAAPFKLCSAKLDFAGFEFDIILSESLKGLSQVHVNVRVDIRAEYNAVVRIAGHKLVQVPLPAAYPV